MKRIEMADSVVIVWDGWTVDFTGHRQLGFVVRCGMYASEEVEEYLVDLVPVEGREKAERLVGYFRRTMLWLNLATMVVASEKWKLKYNPHIGLEVFAPLSEWTPSLDDLSSGEWEGFKLSPKVVGLDSDSVEVFKKTQKLMNMLRQPCQNHAVHNVVIPSLQGSSFAIQFWDRVMDLAYRLHRFPLLNSIFADLITLYQEYGAEMLKMAVTRWGGFPIAGRRTLELWPSLQRLERALIQHPNEFPEHTKSLDPNSLLFSDENKSELENALFLVEPLEALNGAYLGSKEPLIPPMNLCSSLRMNYVAFHILSYRVLDIYIRTRPVFGVGKLSLAAELGLHLLDCMATKVLAPPVEYLSDSSIGNLCPAAVASLFDSITPHEFILEQAQLDPVFRALFRGQSHALRRYRSIMSPSVDLPSNHFPPEEQFLAVVAKTITYESSKVDLNSSFISSTDDYYETNQEEVHEDASDESAMVVDNEESSEKEEPELSGSNHSAVERWKSFYPILVSYLKRPTNVPAVLDDLVSVSESSAMAVDLGKVNGDGPFLSLFSELVYVGSWFLLASLSKNNLKKQYISFVHHIASSQEPLSFIKMPTSKNVSKNVKSTSSSTLSAQLITYSLTSVSPPPHTPGKRVGFEQAHLPNISAPEASFNKLWNEISTLQRSALRPLKLYNILKATNTIAATTFWQVRTFSATSKRIEEAFSNAAVVTDKKQSSLSPENRTMMTMLADMCIRMDPKIVVVEVMKWGTLPTAQVAAEMALHPAASFDFNSAIALSSPSSISKFAKNSGNMPQLTSFSRQKKGTAGVVEAAKRRLDWLELDDLESDGAEEAEKVAESEDAAHSLVQLSAPIVKEIVNAHQRRLDQQDEENQRNQDLPQGMSKHRESVWKSINTMLHELQGKKRVPSDFVDRLVVSLKIYLPSKAMKQMNTLISKLLKPKPSSKDRLVYIALMEELLESIGSNISWTELSETVEDAMNVGASEESQSRGPQQNFRKRTRASLPATLDMNSPATKQRKIVDHQETPRELDSKSILDSIQEIERHKSIRRAFLGLLSSALAVLPGSEEMSRVISVLPSPQVRKLLQDIKRSLHNEVPPTQVFSLCLVPFGVRMDISATVDSEIIAANAGNGTEITMDESSDSESVDETQDHQEVNTSMKDCIEVDDNDDEADWPGTAFVTKQSTSENWQSELLWNNELEQLKSTLELKDVVLCDVSRLGNCLYESLDLALYALLRWEKRLGHRVLRDDLVEFMRQKPSRWFDGIPMSYSRKKIRDIAVTQGGKSKSKNVRTSALDPEKEWVTMTREEAKTRYLEYQQQVGHWGDQIVVKAASEKYPTRRNVK